MMGDQSKRRRIAQQRWPIYFWCALGVVLLAGLAGCRGNQLQGNMITAHLPISSYGQIRRNTEGVTRFSFPLLEIYDHSGTLVYRSNRSTENGRVIRALPSFLQHSRPLPDSSPLAAILEAVPEFRARSHQILQNKHAAVVSTVVASCDACTIQDHALADAQRQILKQSIDILVIEVSPP